MVDSKSTTPSPNPGAYRVDVVHEKQGDTYQVVRCEPVAQFDNHEHAAFLVELLLKGKPNA